ncbi:MAG: T9SS type A sorting domain-containing protein [Candidatus Delongbacteria bacterium]
MIPRQLLVLGCVTQLVLPAAAELVPLGDWPVDATRTALQVEGELFRNCGRVLERWDVAVNPPVLLDSLVLESPPVDLLDWDGLLLVLRADGLLEMRRPQNGWDPPVWTWQGSDCATQLLRHGRWLLPVSPWMPLLDLEDPQQPVVAQYPLGGWGDNFGGYCAAFVGDTLVGDYSDCCGACWDVWVDQRWLALGEGIPQEPAQSLGWIDGFAWDLHNPLVAVDHHLLISTWFGLQVLDPATWTLDQTLSMPDPPEEITLASQADGPLVLASGPSGTLSLHVSAQTTPHMQVLDTLQVAGCRQLRIGNGQALFVANDTVHWIDLANPSELVVTSSLPASGAIRGVGRSGDHLLVRQRELRVFRQADARLEPVAALPLPDGVGVTVSGSLALAGADSSLLVIDLANPSAPTVLCSIPAPGLERMCLDGLRAAYVAAGELVLLSLEDPGLPQERLRLPVGEVSDLAIGGGIVACSEYLEAIRLIDARDLEHVHEGASLPFLSWNMRTAFCGDRLVSAWGAYSGGYEHTHLTVHTLADPFAPQVETERVIEYYTFRGLWAGPDRLLIGAHFTPIWGYGTELFLFDLIEESPLVQTAHWEIDAGNPIPDYALLDGGWLVRHFEASGIELFLDDSILSVAASPTRPASLTLSAAPNPFNPVTRLSFTLERPGAVRLAVFDLLGREVAVLVDGDCAAGARSVTLDAGALASGVYFARLEAAGHSTVVKLALLR